MNRQPPDDNPVMLLPYGEGILSRLASHIILKHENSLPDLSKLSILLPTPHSSIALRKLLLTEASRAGHQALLGPEIDTLTNWINRSTPSQLPVITEQQRELMLVESLVRYPYLHGEASPWSLAESLLSLFDELSERDVRLPDNFHDFLNQIDEAYRKNNNRSTINSDALTGEARLVHDLWQAWQKQMQDSELVDRHTSYLLKLKLNAQQTSSDKIIYLAGFSRFSPAELEWLHSSINRGNTFLWLQSSALPNTEIDYHPVVPIQQILTALKTNPPKPAPVTDYSHCLNTIYDTGNFTLKDRAQKFLATHPDSPLSPHLSLFEARSSEHEAMAIDLQTRQWLIEGRKIIGIVTENRRLARRVRALLERANIALQDTAGWALSTTSAAAVLERWLEAVEEDFAYLPLLDLMKSPFFFPAKFFTNERSVQSHEELLVSVYHFEQSIVLKENISRGLARYQNHVRYRQSRLPEDMAADYDDIYALLDIISEAAKPLLPFLDNKNYHPVKMLEALDKSLSLLGLENTFSEDDAGNKILEEINHMRAATNDTTLRLNWNEFRGWLGRTLERYNFQPNVEQGRVQLMSASQNPLHRFDALIIAGAEREYLPGISNASPFFNDGVRQALGLSNLNEQLSQKFYQFRRLLELSDTILITRRIEQGDEYVVCSPWVERIKSFHTIAYGQDLINQRLVQLTGNAETVVTDRSTSLPEPVTANPGISITDELLPKQISASAYQQLINCPFQFFAARCLKLEPPETIKEMLEKSDYGERVHLSLQAFHTGVNKLPGPFGKPLGENNRDEAIQLLITIANAVFARDLEDNFLHRAWLKRWHELIPAYVNWQIGQQQNWKVKATELNIETSMENHDVQLRGRIDRIDVSKDSPEPKYNILDYKTGAVATEDEVLSGESIQLPFYVLLAQQKLQKSASRVEYLSIDKGVVKSRSAIEGDILDELTHQVGRRLVKSLEEIKNGQPMKAWGDHVTCSRCKMSGLCRQKSWLENSSV